MYDLLLLLNTNQNLLQIFYHILQLSLHISYAEVFTGCSSYFSYIICNNICIIPSNLLLNLCRGVM